MRVVREGSPSLVRPVHRTPHQWVGAAVVGLGDGASRRAEHAHRTSRHVLRQATRIEVLEVYCRRCRVRYTPATEQLPCAAQLPRAS
jgi:hypothetical protein